MKNSLQNLGQPNLKINDFRLWLHGREFPDLDDYEDANWLFASVYIKNINAEVWIRNEPFIFTPCIKKFIAILKILLAGKLDMAHLDMVEPNLAFDFEVKTPNLIRIKIQITPDTTKEGYEYICDIEKDVANSLITDLQKILNDYPIKGKPKPNIDNEWDES